MLVVPICEAKITGLRFLSFYSKKNFFYLKRCIIITVLLDANWKCLTTSVESLEFPRDNLYLLFQKDVTT